MSAATWRVDGTGWTLDGGLVAAWVERSVYEHESYGWSVVDDAGDQYASGIHATLEGAQADAAQALAQVQR